MTSLDTGARTCTDTGVRLVPASGGRAYRVAKDRGRAALEGYPNSNVGELPRGTPDRRGRWDTIGSTLYFADSPQTAFAEVLAPLKSNRHRLEVAATRSGYASAEDYVSAVFGQSAENNVDKPWAISGRWQLARSIYHVGMPTDGWWVQIDHADTLQALQRALHTTGLPRDLWSADLENANRAVTTVIAEHIRRLELDDGQRPLGIWYQSRTLIGRCYAWWDRRRDDGLGLGANDPRLEYSTNVDTPALREIADRFDLPVLAGKAW